MRWQKPCVPGSVISSCTTCRDTSAGSLLDKAKFTVETKCAGGVTSLQGGWMGSIYLFKVINRSISVIEKKCDNKSAMVLEQPGT
jgi:hypothetical protein